MIPEEDPYGEYIPVRVFWDYAVQEWKCRCILYDKYGKCIHLVRYRDTIEVRVKEEYL